MDRDGDGYGSGDVGYVGCDPLSGYVDVDGDCDESDAQLSPATIWYADGDGDGFGSPEVTRAACDAPSGFVSNMLDCDDGDSTVNPSALEVCDGLDNTCDGTVDSEDGDSVCALSGEVLLEFADAEFLAEEANTILGVGVGLDGDMDGDGTSDIVITAPGASGFAGAAYVWYGGSAPRAGSTPPSSANLSLSADSSNDFLGRSVSASTDLNGDGLADVVLGATGLHADTGGVYVVYGRSPFVGLQSVPSVASLLLLGEEEGDGAGGAVCSLPDFDLDGRGDLVVGANTAAGTGVAYLIQGPADLSGQVRLVDAAVRIEGMSSGDDFGWVTVDAGDLDGDGSSDLAVGGPQTWLVDGEGGYAVVLLGGEHLEGEALNAADTDVIIRGGEPGGRAGRALAGGQDVNDDGFDDLLVGAPSINGERGGAYLIWGGSSLAETSRVADAGVQLLGDTQGDQAGASVLLMPDMDGDGYAEMLVGAPGEDSVEEDAGAVYVVPGHEDSGVFALEDAAAVLRGAAAGDGAGLTLSGGGDHNGDGRSDLLIGAYTSQVGGVNSGRVFLMYGTGR
ncbi:MAG: FG-GAP repeat protein [Alphaproteobacteria bacterium]|nr:FG-GAP repeat protein [Alphaproteobacteria bacterium]